ncbi:hypothetical protein Pint_02937 [Pistacia integerrima]|uniref:Uncharacterized protein n=1 Tax=Pistacia integerrima TaxID=434235 RepID=A0ACC0ZP48_9ROSI|nr:hypothetical protein Pint_02937 [Pistacia integerrima]
MAQKSSPIDPRSGFNSINKTFHSLRPPLDLPEEDTPLSAAEYAFSLRLKSPLPHDSVALINLITGHRIFYSQFTTRTNPESEIVNQVKLSKPVIAFATSSTVHKLPTLEHQPILIDSPEFESMMVSSEYEFERVKLSQSHLAAILYSSGTTGRVKGVMLSHRNLISEVATICATRKKPESTAVMLQTTNMYFNISGFIRSLASVALCETFVVNGMERFDAKKMLKAVEKFSVTNMIGAPPVMVALCKGSLTDSFDLSSLASVVCGGAPFWKDAMEAFMARFPKVVLLQGRFFLQYVKKKVTVWVPPGDFQGVLKQKLLILKPVKPCLLAKKGNFGLKDPQQ